MKPSPTNPYVVGVPVRDPSMFFGRKDMLRQVRCALTNRAQPTSIVFYGGRRVGKTSVLNQLHSGYLGEDFVPVLINMEETAETDTESFLRGLAEKAVAAIHTRTRFRERFDDPRVAVEGGSLDAAHTCGASQDVSIRVSEYDWAKPYAAFIEFLEAVREQLGGRKLLFLVDECERIRSLVEGGLMAQEIYGYLKSLTESELPIAFVFTGSHRVSLDRNEFLPHLFSACEFHEVTFLERGDAEDLVRDPAREWLTYETEAIEYIWEMAAGHPFFTQLICQKVFQALTGSGTTVCRREDIASACREIIGNPPLHLAYVWQSEMDVKGKLVASALGEVTCDGHPHAVVTQIDEQLASVGISMARGAIEASLDDLLRARLVHRDVPNGRVRYSMGILRDWVLNEHSLAATAYEVGSDVNEPGGATPKPDTPTHGRERRPRTFYLVLGLIGIAACIGLVLLVKRPPPKPERYPVPNLTGLSLEDARSWAWGDEGGSHFVVVDSGKRLECDFPEPGRVVGQDIAPGTLAEPGDTVFVRLSVAPQAGAATQQERNDTVRDEIIPTYNRWLDAWKAEDIDAFMSHYADDCSVERIGRAPYGKEECRRRMAQLFASRNQIRIEADEPVIHVSDDRVTASLEVYQSYEDSRWWDKGTKRLEYRKTRSNWLIVEESFNQEAGGHK